MPFFYTPNRNQLPICSQDAPILVSQFIFDSFTSKVVINGPWHPFKNPFRFPSGSFLKTRILTNAGQHRDPPHLDVRDGIGDAEHGPYLFIAQRKGGQDIAHDVPVTDGENQHKDVGERIRDELWREKNRRNRNTISIDLRPNQTRFQSIKC